MSDVRAKISKICFPHQSAASCNWEIPSSQCWGIVAEPGLGRSAFLRAIAGFNRDLPIYEEFILDETSISLSSSSTTRMKRGVFYLPRKAVVFSDMSLWENLLIAEMPKRLGPWLNEYRFKEEARRILHKVGIDHPIEQKASILTRSEEQLLGFARTFLNSRKLVLIDESSANLSSQDRDRFEFLIDELKSEGVSVIYAIPNLVDESAICNKIFSLTREGLIEIQSSEGSRSFSRKRKIVGSSEVEVNFPPKRDLRGQEVIARFENVQVDAPNETLVGPINFDLKKGEILGFLGPAEGGRLDFLLGLFGGIKTWTSKGKLVVSGKNFSPGNSEEVFSAGISVLSGYQSLFGLFESQNLGFNLSISSLERIQSFGFLKKRKEYETFDHYKNVLRMNSGRATDRVEKSSRIDLVKLLLARALLRKPKLIFLDEPTRGLNENERGDLYYFLREIADQGVSLILSSSSVHEQMAFCDRLFIINDGLLRNEFIQPENHEREILESL